MKRERSEARKSPLNIFISYAIKDKARFKLVASRLKEIEGVNVFSDEDVERGANIASFLVKKISGSDIFMPIVSSYSSDSSSMMTELGVAWGQGMRIIPVVTTESLLKKIPVKMEGRPIFIRNIRRSRRLRSLEKLLGERFKSGKKTGTAA
jgi:hypothetical protein